MSIVELKNGDKAYESEVVEGIAGDPGNDICSLRVHTGPSDTARDL